MTDCVVILFVIFDQETCESMSMESRDERRVFSCQVIILQKYVYEISILYIRCRLSIVCNVYGKAHSD